MPWLEKDNNSDDADDGQTSTSTSNTVPITSKQLLFIHVPRCGGTSLMKSHNVPYKATQHSNYYHKLGMKIFFHRYKLLEKANFPLWTRGNAICLFMIFSNIYLRYYVDFLPTAMTNFSIIFFSLMFFGLTFIFVAPTIGRIIYIRRIFLLSVEYILWGAMENIEYLTGTNIHGYLPHMTAHKMLHYGYVTPIEMETVSSLAIVRNPYSRMVSVFMYNRFGSQETFRHFVYSWYKNMKYYRDYGEMEEWYTPCHVIPQFEYSHHSNGTVQLVQSIVKQEELKYLKKISNPADVAIVHLSSPSSGSGITKRMEDEEDDDNEDQYENDSHNKSCDDEEDTNSICSKSSSISSSEEYIPQGLTLDEFTSISSLPDTIRDALLGMPHDNKRKTKTPWYEHYDQETLNLTYEMYHRDFEIFGYDTVLEQRPDLDMPPPIIKEVSV